MNEGLGWEVRDRTLRLTPVLAADIAGATSVVRVRYAGLCGSDVAKLAPDWPGLLPEPWRPGHEIVGVEANTGRWVAIDPLVPCGICDRCSTGVIQLCPGLRRVGWDLPGGLADVIAVPSANLVPLPGLADPAHAVLADPMAVALHGVRCGLGAPVGRLGIIGSGVLAVCTAASALAAGWRVHLAVRDRQRAAALRRVLDAAVVATPEDLPTCDAVVDAASGNTDRSMRQALAAVRDGGTVLAQTAYRPDVALSTPLRDVFCRSITVRGSFSYCRAGGRDDFRDAVGVLDAASGWPELLTRTQFRLADLPAALDALCSGPTRPYRAVLAPMKEE